jgi:DNA-directed RNA polymerase III subunit RPC6
MATRRDDGAQGVKTENGIQMDKSKADMLYEKAAQQPTGTVFFQRDLSSMGVAEDIGEILVLSRELAENHLFKLLTYDGEPCWSVRPRDVAEK